MDIARLNRLMGKSPKNEQGYKLPTIHEDELVSDNIISYGRSKTILEHPQINNTLQEMNAFDLIVVNDVKSYIRLAEKVASAIAEYNEHNDDPIEIPALDIEDKLDEDFTHEFITELTFQMLSESDIDMDDPVGSAPKPTKGMIHNLMQKLGIRDDLDIVDMLYMYLFQRFLGGRHDTVNHFKELSESQTQVLNSLMEKAPPGMEGWVKKVKQSFMDEYGDDWEEVLYSTAWKKYNEGRVNEADERSCPKMPKEVKSDVKNCMKDLDEKIKEYESRERFDIYKPSYYNAKRALEDIMDLCGGSMADYKEAQLLLLKLKGPVTDYFPASLVKYLSHGGGEPVLKEV